MTRSANHPWLHRLAVLTAAVTLALIGIGGLVTSHEAGLAVPDWPTSGGYNPFLFPLEKWWHGGNIFYEHSHRLFASGVGLLTIILAVWLALKESRRWLRWLGVIAVVAVVLQGVLGGLRVILLKDEIGIFHATLAQLFFVLTCAIALFTSKAWLERRPPLARRSRTKAAARRDDADLENALALRHAGPEAGAPGAGVPNTGAPMFRRLLLGATVLILLQLMLGATMRHQHAGLAISDFPLAHGKLWPAMDPSSIALYNAQRSELNSLDPITAFHVVLQMTHRIMAVLILAAVAACAWMAVRRFTWRGTFARVALFWLGLILVQAGLGAATVLSNKAADVATAHVLAGALSLATGALMCIVSFRNPESARRASVLSRAGAQSRDESAFGPETIAAR